MHMPGIAPRIISTISIIYLLKKRKISELDISSVSIKMDPEPGPFLWIQTILIYKY